MLNIIFNPEQVKLNLLLLPKEMIPKNHLNVYTGGVILPQLAMVIMKSIYILTKLDAFL
jgi:hypothetical protein